MIAREVRNKGESTPAKVRILFIGGANRSGSTILDRLIGLHPGIVSLGELHNIWERGVTQNQLCGCNVAFRECAFWQGVFEDAYGGLEAQAVKDAPRLQAAVVRYRHMLNASMRRLRSRAFDRDFREYSELICRLHEALLSRTGAVVLTDSSKSPRYGAILGAMKHTDVYLVHLVRDSRAVAFSEKRAKVRPEVHWQKEHFRVQPLRESARRWMVQNLLTEWLKRRATRSKRIRYEDLAIHPDTLVREVWSWVGVDSEHRVPTEASTVSHTVSGNPSRFDAKLVVRPDTEWMQAMRGRDRWVVTALTFPLLLRYGYAIAGH